MVRCWNLFVRHDLKCSTRSSAALRRASGDPPDGENTHDDVSAFHSPAAASFTILSRSLAMWTTSVLGASENPSGTDPVCTASAPNVSHLSEWKYGWCKTWIVGENGNKQGWWNEGNRRTWDKIGKMLCNRKDGTPGHGYWRFVICESGDSHVLLLTLLNSTVSVPCFIDFTLWTFTSVCVKYFVRWVGKRSATPKPRIPWSVALPVASAMKSNALVCVVDISACSSGNGSRTKIESASATKTEYPCCNSSLATTKTTFDCAYLSGINAHMWINTYE